ncbi:MAG: type I 3-dehydroquinate dehydratase [Methanomicrobiales archaeon]|nr:type I 3-dehydroquinate dehydratase [Methanomicrobiales archaeon]
MKIVVSVMNAGSIREAVAEHPDLLELRLDALAGLKPARDLPLPVIATLRSREEGGFFSGDQTEWYSIVRPWAGTAAYIDIEERYAACAPVVKAEGSAVIASVHLPGMPSEAELERIERRLRAYGDIPKIVVTPSSRDDILTLLHFTLHAEKPICTGVLGQEWRHARVLLPLYGSGLAYCHAGIAAASGQYHVRELKQLLGALA